MGMGTAGTHFPQSPGILGVIEAVQPPRVCVCRNGGRSELEPGAESDGRLSLLVRGVLKLAASQHQLELGVRVLRHAADCVVWVGERGLWGGQMLCGLGWEEGEVSWREDVWGQVYWQSGSEQESALRQRPRQPRRTARGPAASARRSWGRLPVCSNREQIVKGTTAAGMQHVVP